MLLTSLHKAKELYMNSITVFLQNVLNANRMGVGYWKHLFHSIIWCLLLFLPSSTNLLRSFFISSHNEILITIQRSNAFLTSTPSHISFLLSEKFITFLCVAKLHDISILIEKLWLVSFIWVLDMVIDYQNNPQIKKHHGELWLK